MNVHSIILTVLFLIFFAFSIKKFIYNYVIDIMKLNRLAKTGRFTVGKIVGFREDTDADGRKIYLPMFEYEVDGQVLQKQSDIPQQNAISIGDYVKVTFSKDSDEAYIDIEKQISHRIVGIVVVVFMLSLIAFLTIKAF
jgi:hypothetical protein